MGGITPVIHLGDKLKPSDNKPPSLIACGLELIEIGPEPHWGGRLHPPKARNSRQFGSCLAMVNLAVTLNRQAH